MSVAFRKVWRDLWNNKGRTTLVVLSIAVGVMAVGMILSSNHIISRQLGAASQGDHWPNVQMSLAGLVDDETVLILSRLPEVKQMDGYIQTSIQWKPSLDAEEWKDATLIALDNYAQQRFSVLTLIEGAWPGEGAAAVSANHVLVYQVPPVGGAVYFKVNDRPKLVRLSGTLRDPLQFGPPFSQQAAFYVTRGQMELLVGFRDYNQLRFDVPEFSQERAQAAANAVEERLKKIGVAVGGVQISDPQRHFFQETLDGFGLVLVVMAVASLGLSTFLVINTIIAIIAQQVPQIGIMKTIGGLRGQIAQLYLAGVVVYGALSLALAVPLGAVGGDLISRGLLTTLNIPVAALEVLPTAFAVQALAGLLTPVLAALWPVLQGVAISVREAIAAYGVGRGRYGGGRIDKLMGRVKGLPRMFTLMLRNTFRRMERVALTEITLIAAGAIFMMITAASASFGNTLDEFWRGLGFHVIIVFEQFQRSGEVVPLMEARPNVERAEMWVWLNGKARAPGKTGVGNEFDAQLRGVPADTEMYAPTITAGRALDPHDGHAILLSQLFAAKLGVKVGDQIVLDLPGVDETTWTVVGTVFDVIDNTAFVRRDVLLNDLHQVGQGIVAEIRADTEDPAVQEAIAKDLKTYFASQGTGIVFALSKAENRRQNDAAFSLITNILQVMTVLMAVVGSLGLSGTLSINVLERRREIGVMRAVGASSGDVGWIFMGEGLLLGVLSWAQAVPLSIVAGKFFVDALGRVFGLPFLYLYPASGALTWLAIVVVLSLGASWLPAHRATQISVRESLAYE